MIVGNACSECVCFYSGQGATMPHGHSLQRGAPTVGALGDTAMDENGRAMNRNFQLSWVYIFLTIFPLTIIIDKATIALGITSDTRVTPM
jgi:hypothetical protein